ncbi:MAG: LacI family DNA-binding transcriptional regulator [Janthinobacterium lividum]
MPSLKSVTLKDVAERAKVSQSVVSTVLNERQNGIFVSEGTRLNVLAAAAHLGYTVRPRALPPIRKPGFPARRSGGAAQSHLVGVLLGRRFGGSLFTDTFYGVNETLAAQGYHPLVLDTYADTYQKAAEKEAEGLRYARESGFAGVVLWHEGGPANIDLIESLRREMPVVAIDRRVPGVTLDFVGTDNFDGAYQATQHLISLGHTKISHLTRMETTEAAADRLRGYQQALHDSGLEFNPRNLILVRDGGRYIDKEQTDTLFTGRDAPTAIFLLADYWAPAVVADLRRLDLRVPEDIALVGFDDVVPPGLDDLGLTTMAQDFSGIGKTAGELVLRRLADPQADYTAQVFPAHLVVRHSSLGFQKDIEAHTLPSRSLSAKPALAATASS